MIRTNLDFHHVGVATKDISAERDMYLKLDYRVEGRLFHDPLQQVRGLFMVNGGMRVELLEPDSPSSPLNVIIANRQKMYHQCYECDNLEGTIHSLESAGGRVVSPPKPAVAFGGRRVAFVMLPGMTLVELLERADRRPS